MGCGSAKISQKDDSGRSASVSRSNDHQYNNNGSHTPPHHYHHNQQHHYDTASFNNAMAGASTWSDNKRSSSYHFSIAGGVKRDPDFRRQRFATTASTSISSGVSSSSRRSDFSMHSATTISGTSRICVTLSEDGSMLEVQTETFYPEPLDAITPQSEVDVDVNNPSPSTSRGINGVAEFHQDASGRKHGSKNRMKIKGTIHSSLIDLKQYEKEQCNSITNKTQMLKARSRKSDYALPLRKINSGIEPSKKTHTVERIPEKEPCTSSNSTEPVINGSNVNSTTAESLKGKCFHRLGETPSPINEVLYFPPSPVEIAPTSVTESTHNTQSANHVGAPDTSAPAKPPGCRVRTSASDFAISSRPKGGSKNPALPPKGSSKSFDCVTSDACGDDSRVGATSCQDMCAGSGKLPTTAAGYLALSRLHEPLGKAEDCVRVHTDFFNDFGDPYDDSDL